MSVIDKIKSRYHSFSNAQKKIANFIINKPEVACFYSLKEMSNNINVTEVTFLKFTKKVGYDSFLEFKKDLQEHIRKQLSPNTQIVKSVKDLNHKGSHCNYKEVLDVEIQALNSTLDYLDLNELEKAVHCLKEASRIYLAGEMLSKTLTTYLLYRLRPLGFNPLMFDTSTYADMSNQLVELKSSDVFILCSFPDYSQKTIRLSNYLKERGVKIITFTDKITSPLAKNGYVNFICASDSSVFYNSMNSPIVVANILTSCLAIYVKDDIDDVREKAEAINIFMRNRY